MLRILVSCLAAAAGIGHATEPDIVPGSLLVAAESLGDPNFSRSVVLIVRHEEAGTVGLIVTRPLDISPGYVLPELKGLGQYDGPLYSGGPVMPFGMLTLIRSAEQPADTEAVTDQIWLGSLGALEAALKDRDADTRHIRVYAGHAGWRTGQLISEILDGAWTVINGRSAEIFSRPTETLWQNLTPPVSYRASLDAFSHGNLHPYAALAHP